MKDSSLISEHLKSREKVRQMPGSTKILQTRKYLELSHKIKNLKIQIKANDADEAHVWSFKICLSHVVFFHS